MSDENKIVVPVEGDTKPFDEAIDKSAKKANDALTKGIKKPLNDALDPKKAADKTDDVIESMLGEFSSRFPMVSSLIMNPITAAFASAGAVGAKLVSDIFEGEAVKKIEKNFESVTASFNVAGDKMLDAFMANTAGLVDNTDVMKTLTEKTVTFNGQVDKLPDLFNVARKAASVFGRDSLEVFDDLTRAAQTGNAKVVKYLFPKLDLEKEVQKYAYANKILVADITETQRQQIALNALIDIGSKKFAGATLSAGTLSEEWQKLKVAYGNLREEQQKDAAGGLFASSLKEAIIDSRNLVNSLGDQKLVSVSKNIYDSMYNIKIMTAKLQQAEEDYRNTQNDRFLIAQGHWKKEIELEQRLIDMRKKQEKDVGEINPMFKLSFQNSIVPPTPVPLAGKFPTEAEKEIEKQQTDAQAKYLQRQKEFLSSYSQQSQSAQSALLAKNFEKNKDEEVSEGIHWLAMDKIKSDYAVKQDAIGKQLLEKGLIDQDAFNNRSYMGTQIYLQAKSDLENNKRMQEQMETIAHNERMKQVEQQKYADSMSGAQGFAAGVSGYLGMVKLAAQDTANSYSNSMKQIADASIKSLGNGVASGFKKMVLAMREGKNAVQAFGEAFLAALGDAMVQMGTSYVAMAIPMMILQDPKGYALLGAGFGLIAAGTLLSASVGGGTTQGVGGASTGGASPQSFDTTGGSTSQNYATASTQNQAVQVVVQGNVYDMDATGKQIADVISSAFQTQGVRVYS
jgi:hypothetical protein